MIFERAGRIAMKKLGEPVEPKPGTQKSARRWRWAGAGVLVAAVGVLIAYQAVRINNLSAQVALFTKIRRQEIDYVQAMTERTFTLKPTNGMVFHQCDGNKALLEPVDELILPLRWIYSVNRSNHWVSEFAYYTDAGRLGAVDVSAMHNDKADYLETHDRVAWELLSQVTAQDKGWFARGSLRLFRSPVSVVYGQHAAGMLTLIAYRDREDPDCVLVDYVFHLSACPARGGGVSEINSQNVSFFRPACPPRQ
ncbi:MAG: hypothetical protein WBD63_11310 [Phycisphaerae bacterium]|nr:hypothetical protein [Phycisphaerae bacterium]